MVGVTITKDPAFNVEPDRAVFVDISVAAKVVHTLLRLQFPSDWEVVEWARLQVAQQTREQSSIIDSYC